MIRVCEVGEVPVGEGRAVTVGDRRLAVFHTRVGWYAVAGACPHLGGPLADGIVADRSVICPLHARRFDLASGAELGGSECVEAHRVQVVADEVWVELSADAPVLAPGMG